VFMNKVWGLVVVVVFDCAFENGSNAAMDILFIHGQFGWMKDPTFLRTHPCVKSTSRRRLAASTLSRPFGKV
jgi:hypothetical protein